MGDSPILQMAKRYPQLLLPIRPGEKDSPEYKAAVLRGKPLAASPAFFSSEEDALFREETPAGPAEILVLGRREDFEHSLRALAYRCEPVEIPSSVGASTVRGLINWEKIRARQREYALAGGTDWSGEFKRFTAEKKNYLDSVILLSTGWYSAVSPQEAGMDAARWREKSLTIRRYHELTHFICRGLHPEDQDPIRDEVLADLIGLAAAFGRYDPALARRFLGIEGGAFRPGGRLSHYTAEERLAETVEQADRWIEHYTQRLAETTWSDVFGLLLQIFPM